MRQNSVSGISDILSVSMLREVIAQLAEPTLAVFTSKLVPTESPERIIGVRMPALRRLAKQLLTQEKRTGNRDLIGAFLAEDPHDFLEEDQLHMILVAERAQTLGEAISSLEAFVPRAHFWILTDGLVPRIFKKEPLAAKPYIMQWLHADSPWLVRIALVNLISLYTDELFDDETMREAATVAIAQQDMLSDEYYLNMALAWYLSMCVVKHPEAGITFLSEQTLPRWVHNKTLQKIRESRLCSAELKAKTQSLKR